MIGGIVAVLLYAVFVIWMFVSNVTFEAGIEDEHAGTESLS